MNCSQRRIYSVNLALLSSGNYLPGRLIITNVLLPSLDSAIFVNAFQPMDHWQTIYSNYSSPLICDWSSRLRTFVPAP